MRVLMRLRFSNLLLVFSTFLLVFSTLLLGCAGEDHKEGSSQRLATLIQNYEEHEAYDEEAFPLGLYTEAYFKSEAEFAQALLDSLQMVDPGALAETELISFELLKFVLEDKVNRYDLQLHLNPLLSDSGFHLSMNYQVRPLNNYAQTKTYLKKLMAFPAYVDQHFALLRKGLEEGRMQPRVIFNGYESSYEKHLVAEAEDSFFYSPFKELPKDLTADQRDSVLTAAKRVIEDAVTPQFQRIKVFFEEEYLPQLPTAIGALHLKNGEDLYQNRIEYYTTDTIYTAQEIHDLGMAEVKRIKAEMLKVIKLTGFEGSFEEFFHFLRNDPQFYPNSAEELLTRARDIAKRVDAQLPRYFITLPRKPYGVAPVPDAIAPKYTAGRYIGTEKESTDPGWYWVNTYDLKSRTLYTLPALTVHEAVPGHHLQNSLNNELGDSIPQFRRDLYLSAYGEGWGLYTEYLAEEMGMYTTPYEKFGQLTYEMWRACRLVVDTGIHALGWSREEVVSFMRANTALSLHEIETETDRYISWPGQALSYKIGELKIRQLRGLAEEELGSDFDLREFHELILEQGTVTLPILERRIKAYIAKKKSA